MTDRERFLATCECRPVDRPPVWLMRQAGRCLPEYRALREKHSFLELVQEPELAAEVTLQPVRRFGFDAAILFSDILIVPQALGQGFEFGDTGGLKMDYLIKETRDIERLQVGSMTERLAYVADALRLVRRDLASRTALIGFAGSPWTLANFMMEGGGVREFTRARAFFYEDERGFFRLMEKLTHAVIHLLQLQIDAGVDAVQIFDSSGGLLAPGAFQAASARWIRQIVVALERQVPVIVFSKGMHSSWAALSELGAQVLGIDWTVRLSQVREEVPRTVALQGNLDPVLLQTTPEAIAAATRSMLAELEGETGHIVNLGHGVPPAAKLECIEALVETVRSRRLSQPSLSSSL